MGVCASLNSTIKIKGDDEKIDVESGDIGEIRESDNEDTVSAGSNERPDIDDIYVTVAIDIGTSYSGYSFCFKDAWMGFKATTEPEEKVPTVLLLNPDETLNSFGHDAITTFHEMDEVQRRECFYITNFKLCLYRVSKLSFQTTLKAGNKHINAMHVFSLTIKHFMTMACDTIFNHSDEQSQVSDINEENVDWILTVPSIWTDSAREFMLESAKKAGIMPEKLRIVLASEAAAIYFRENELQEMVPESEEETGTTGFKYIMAELGGGVVDVCVHEVLEDQRIRELYMSTGGDIGSSAINSAYIIFLESLVGREIWTEFRTLHRKSYLDIINNYEQVKRTFSMTNDESLRLLLNKELAQTFSRKTGKSLKTVVSANFTDDSVRLSEDEEELFINQSLMELFFCPAVDDILGKINKVLVECNDPDLSTLVLSGGFAESPYLQERLQNNLQIETMLVVKNACSAVLQGALLLSDLPPDSIQRRSRFTYGFDVTVPYIADEHPVSLKFTDEGSDWCNGVFDKVIEKNQLLEYGQMFVRKRTGQALDIEKKHQERYASLWRSTNENPRFCLANEEVQEVGVIVMRPPPEGWPDQWEAENRLIVGETGFTVKRVDKNTGQEYETTMTFLQ